MASRPLHILVLVDRDWTHPQAGGTGANLEAHVRYWTEWGHRVTIMAGSYPGAVACERRGPVTIHRRGGRVTVFPHTFARLRRGLVPDADVVLEIINGITFLTPLWLRTPRAQYVHHVHREQYIEELGRFGQLAAFVAETAPLRWLYRRHGSFITVSEATARQLMELGISRDAIEVNYHGPDPDEYGPGTRAAEPTLIYLGRLKRYKRIEVLLDILDTRPEVVLDIVGVGEHRPVLEAEIAQRGLENRVRMHGFVEHDRKVELLQRSWALVTASAAEGWGLTTLEAAACATPSVALGVGGLAEAVEHEHTGLLARDSTDMVVQASRILDDAELRERLGTSALRRAQNLGWRHTVARTLAVLQDQLEGEAVERPQGARARVPDVVPEVLPGAAEAPDGVRLAPSSTEGE